MFVRTKLNSSGSTSVQIISKVRGHYKVMKRFGSATTQQEIDNLVRKAQQEIVHLSKPKDLFPSETDEMVKSVLSTLSNSNIQTVGPEITIDIDYEKYNYDHVWDGLKGYITNSRISNQEVMMNYKNLWFVEKAFRISKTDLRIRPIYHGLRDRIEAHICIAFTAYCIYKDLERALYQVKSTLSLKKAAEVTHNMYQITYTLPASKHTERHLLKMDQEQQELYDIIQNNF